MIVAEGDSWFDYPFYDVLQKLDERKAARKNRPTLTPAKAAQ